MLILYPETSTVQVARGYLCEWVGFGSDICPINSLLHSILQNPLHPPKAHRKGKWGELQIKEPVHLEDMKLKAAPFRYKHTYMTTEPAGKENMPGRGPVITTDI